MVTTRGVEADSFNAIRIALASPEQIKSWSYGQVTKPETINYRTLKPEKDGLFCERIFGPTKDFECYCGKYKRVRYKGIICDRCGVEVARSKVRRERMGHISLAAPVSHIWYVKGTPSRLGLLLDVSPRTLERILYFAQYTVTNVDEEARERALKELEEGTEGEKARLVEQNEEAIAGVKSVAENAVKDLQARLQGEKATIEEELKGQIAQIQEGASELEGRLKDQMGKEAPEDLVFQDTVIVQGGKKISKSHITSLSKAIQKSTKELQGQSAERIAEAEKRIEEQIKAQSDKAIEQINELRRRLVEEKEALKAEIKQKTDELQELRPLLMLTESRYREMKERYGSIFTAGMGADAILEILKDLDLEKLRESLQQEIHSSSGQRYKKATKRLRVVEALYKSGNHPSWMILTVLPVLPPDLRPMVQLDGGRFATSDLNDLYRRVINRNNRLKRLLELGAPEIIIRNEKRMLQEAVDALIDNGRRGRAIAGSHNHKLKSLSDMLRGKQGRFRQNLLGKRVDYSGRSVIVVGPNLKMHQCGLPKRMALELFKPFVMQRLVLQGQAHNIKSAKRMVERVRPEVWDILEEVTKERPVLLNRAPTLHRLGIQAFWPVLIDGSAVQLHPLVCTAFNADFDGDQMAVHLPLSRAAVIEAKKAMISSSNMLSPSSQEPIAAPTLDIVLGCYYMTLAKPNSKGEGRVFLDFEDAKLAYDLGQVDLQAEIEVINWSGNGRIKTTIGRILFNDILPEGLGFRNQIMDKKALKDIAAECFKSLGSEQTARVLDGIKDLGFRYATKSGMTIALNDLNVPEQKAKLLEEADEKVAEQVKQFQRGLITEEELYINSVQIWEEASDQMTNIIEEALPSYGSVYLMAQSGAKGNIAQVKQMAGMRGLMTDPRGRIIDLPIRSSFREGLTVLEYFISTHGARKGLADTALRTADSGYLTRRLIDVSQEVIITEEDCGTPTGHWISYSSEIAIMGSLAEWLVGRITASPVVHPESGDTIAEAKQEIDEAKAKEIEAAEVDRVYVRSPLGCEARRGLCQMCYGWSPARGQLVGMGEAVGVIAAQSIGEPGTQLTMRTFHTGGVAGTMDITSGLPRVEELFEARSPKGQAVLAEIDSTIHLVDDEDGRKMVAVSSEEYRDEYEIPSGYKLSVAKGQFVDTDTVLAEKKVAKKKRKKEEEGETSPEPPILARMPGQVEVNGKRISVRYEEEDRREYVIPATTRVLVKDGEQVKAGQRLTEGPINPQDILRIMGKETVQQYLVQEVQKVYKSQGVNINDKHIETIVRQMLRKVRVDSQGDTELLPGELVDRFVYQNINATVLAEGGEPAIAHPVLLGVTKASLNTESFLAAASFQETTKILTEAALKGSVDRLLGLKENVIIGRLIPARLDLPELKELVAAPPTELPEGFPFEREEEEEQPSIFAPVEITNPFSEN
ncbi:MAG: DNA-directed RNA polymerase subunit beta' [Dehalococcoidia bacterium]